MVDPQKPKRWSRFRTIQRVLNELCTNYGFTAAVLVGIEGLPLAAAEGSAGEDAEMLAAVAAQLRRSARSPERQMGWSGLDEINMVSEQGQRLIGRPLVFKDQEMILVGLLPRWMSYRKATTQALGVIRWAWQDRTHESSER